MILLPVYLDPDVYQVFLWKLVRVNLERFAVQLEGVVRLQEGSGYTVPPLTKCRQGYRRTIFIILGTSWS